MAKGRKPAIDGLARPQGFLDDIVRPIIQKGARKVANKAMVGTSKRSYRIMSAADKLEDKVAKKRIASYYRRGEKKLGGDMLISAKNRRHQKAVVLAEKADALERSASVRKVAKARRAAFRKR